MFGPLTTKCEKVLESYPFERSVKESYQIKIKSKDTTEDMFISNIF